MVNTHTHTPPNSKRLGQLVFSCPHFSCLLPITVNWFPPHQVKNRLGRFKQPPPAREKHAGPAESIPSVVLYLPFHVLCLCPPAVLLPITCSPSGAFQQSDLPVLFCRFASFLLPTPTQCLLLFILKFSNVKQECHLFLKLLPSTEVIFTGSNILQSYEACIALNYIAVPARSSHIFEYESSQGFSFLYREYILLASKHF